MKSNVLKTSHCWEKTFAKQISDQRLVATIYKQLLKSNNNRMNNPTTKVCKNMNRYLTRGLREWSWNGPPWFTDYFKLKSIKAQQTQEAFFLHSSS